MGMPPPAPTVSCCVSYPGRLGYPGRGCGFCSESGVFVLRPVLRNQMTPLIFDPRVVLFRNILTPGHSVWVRVRGKVRVRVRGSIYFGGSKYFVTPA